MFKTEWRRSALAMPFVALGLVVSLAAQQAPRVIEVKAKKYDFEPSIIEVQQGERVGAARDVHRSAAWHRHREVRRQQGSPEGQTVDVEFVASSAGTYKVLCTEDCGKGHDDMVGTLVVKAVAQ